MNRDEPAAPLDRPAKMNPIVKRYSITQAAGEGQPVPQRSVIPPGNPDARSVPKSTGRNGCYKPVVSRFWVW
jgi:hypothetical protein